VDPASWEAKYTGYQDMHHELFVTFDILNTTIMTWQIEPQTPDSL
jgi:hypothetical protein